MSMMNPQAEPLISDDDKLIMGHIASGHSAYDLIVKYMKTLTVEERCEILEEVLDLEKELDGIKECYRDTYNVLLESCNETLSEG